MGLTPFDSEYQPAQNSEQFCASSYHWRDLIFETFDSENLGQDHVVEKNGLAPFDSEYQRL